MISVRKRGKVYQYDVAPIDRKRKRVTKSGFKTKEEAEKAGTIAYNEYMQTGHNFVPSTMSYSDYLDYWMKEHCDINLKYHTIEALSGNATTVWYFGTCKTPSSYSTIEIVASGQCRRTTVLELVLIQFKGIMVCLLCFVGCYQAGYIESNIVPEFAECQNDIDWFKAMGQWKERGFTPKPRGYYIF